jgi:hypothetical protein
MSDNLGFRRLVEALDELHISYYICGSVASSIHGIYRTTADIDFVADVQPRHAPLLAARLGKEFYIDPDMIDEALRRSRSFNLIHYASSYKYDIFPLQKDAYQQVQLERRNMETLSLGDEKFQVPVASPEDTLLNKLAWYRAGGETSDRQWNDIRGIVAVQADRLDRDYMRHWARHLKVEDLLERALSQ